MKNTASITLPSSGTARRNLSTRWLLLSACLLFSTVAFTQTATDSATSHNSRSDSVGQINSTSNEGAYRENLDSEQRAISRNPVEPEAVTDPPTKPPELAPPEIKICECSSNQYCDQQYKTCVNKPSSEE